MKTAITGPTIAPLGVRSGPFGTLLRRVDLSTATLTATAYRPKLRLTSHAHTSAFLLFVRDGGFVERHGRRTEHCGRFTCIYRPAYDEHANAFDEGGAVLAAIDIDPAWIARLRDAGFTGERFQIRSPFVEQFAGRLDAELAAADSMSGMVIESLATEVIVFASRAAMSRTIRNAATERARRFIEQQFASPLSLAAIASVAEVHPVHLARQFRASQGCTVGEYIRRLRVAFAARELTNSDRTIAEIAQAAGFCDQSQLTKTFKRVTGRTPGSYRTGR